MVKLSLVDELSESRLATYIFSLAQSIIEPKAKKRIAEKKLSINLSSAFELYIFEVFEAQNRILNTVESLQYIPLLLKRLPPKDFFERYGLNKAKYFQYQLENHIIRISTIYDQMLLFTNAAFQLGIPEKKCSEDLIISNKHTKNTETAKCLKSCKQAIISIVTARNLIVHRGEFKDEDFERLSTFILINKYGDADAPTHNGLNIFSTRMVNYFSKSIQKDKIALMERNNTTLIKILLNFFKSLEPSISNHAITLHALQQSEASK